MTGKEARDLLLAAADPSFKEFNDKIVNCNAAPSIGIRMPRLREIAVQVVKNGWEEYLADMERTFPAGNAVQKVQRGSQKPDAASHGEAPGPDSETPVMYQEEHILWGCVLGKAKMDTGQRVYHLDRYVPGILSWADCDTCVSGFKFMKKDQELWYQYCTGWLGGGREFEVRFGLVALMQYFINDAYIEKVLPVFAGEKGVFGANSGHAALVSSESSSADTPYYIRMAQAWALSVCFVKYRGLTWDVFAAKTIEPWVQNKAIQKCRESFRVSKEDKELLKTLKI